MSHRNWVRLYNILRAIEIWLQNHRPLERAVFKLKAKVAAKRIEIDKQGGR